MSLSLPPFQISNIRLFWTWVGCCWFCNWAWILLIMKNWICYHPIWSYFNYIKNIYKKCFTLSWKLDKLLLVVHGWNAANYSKKMHLKVKKCVASFAFSWVPVTFHKDECLYSTFTSSLSHMQCTDKTTRFNVTRKDAKDTCEASIKKTKEALNWNGEKSVAFT